MSVIAPDVERAVSGVEFASLLIGAPEPFEKSVRLHDELELGAADRMADVEHPILEHNFGDALDVEHTLKIEAVGHGSPPKLLTSEFNASFIAVPIVDWREDSLVSPLVPAKGEGDDRHLLPRPSFSA